MNDNEDAVAKLVRLAGARPRPDAELTARVRGAVHEEWQRATRRRRFVRYGIGAAIAATLAAVLLLRPQTPTATTPSSINWNGASVRVDSGTLFTIVSATEATLQRGTIYFSSQGRTGFTVKTPFGNVRDIGTKFEIRLSDSDMRVRVDEGAVEVRGTRADAGMELVATRETVTPRIKLEGQTLGAVIEQAARAKGLRVKWETERDVVLHGRVMLTPDEAIDAATAASGVEYRVEGNTLIVSRRK